MSNLYQLLMNETCDMERVGAVSRVMGLLPDT